MANLGSAKTNRYQIGVAEIRVGALTLANKLIQANSIGIVDDVAINDAREYAKIKAGFPAKVVDQAATTETVTVTGKLREFSRRNLGILLGQGLLSDVTDVKTTMTANASSTAATIASAVGFTANDLVCVYVANKPDTVSVAKMTTAATSAVFDTDLCLALDYAPYIAAGETVHVFKAAEIAIGKGLAVQYFTLQVVQVDSQSGRPRVWNFWKANCGSGMTMGANVTDYASSDLSLEILEPSQADYGSVGSPLYGVRGLIPSFPMGIYVAGSDVPT